MITPIEHINQYKRVFLDTFISFPSFENGMYSITLNETDALTKLKKVTIYDVPENTILLNFQKYSAIHLGEKLKEMLRDDDRGIAKCCDYLLISAESEKLYVTYIEMKSNNFKSRYIIEQFKGGTCFNTLCCSIAEHFYDIAPYKLSNQIVSYALLSPRNINKQKLTITTKNNQYRKSLTPDKYIQRSVGNASSIPFRWFVTSEPRPRFN